MIHKAQSGHPGGSLSSSDFMAALYFDKLNIDPSNPRWADRDRFVLSKGHACPVWYTCLAMKGFVPMDSIYTLRQLGSVFQGHPVAAKCPGIDATSGSLGIGMAQAVGMALEGKMTKKDFMVYTICGDGEIQEGIIWEASNTASKYKLDNLVLIVDNNGLQNDGYTKDVMPMERLDDKFRAFGWEVVRINGHKMEEVLAALEQGKANKGKPFCIIADTVKGKGVSFMENVRGWHGKPPTDEQLEIALKEIKEGL
jgi:transketolase